MPTLATLQFTSHSAQQTRELGTYLGALLQTGDILCLIGDLGAGKTTLVQGLAAGWGSNDAVSSPTFVLVNVYRRPPDARLYHLDTYRLSGAAEAEDLDLDALLENGPLVVEWADRIHTVLPNDRLWLTMQWAAEEQREIAISAQGPHSQALLDALRQQLAAEKVRGVQ
jgi:tRNA threonylcarbamoyladenosine biosynthesis protein TsaE